MSGNPLQVVVDRIWLQGEEALIPMLPTTEDEVRYLVPGMGDSIEIRDRRATGRLALETARTEEGAQDFHDQFDSPALVTILMNDGKVVVELSEPDHSAVESCDVLWIAALVKDSLPAWPKPWHFRSPSQGDRRSFVAILE